MIKAQIQMEIEAPPERVFGLLAEPRQATKSSPPCKMYFQLPLLTCKVGRSGVLLI